MKSTFNIKTMAEIAMFAAIGYVLDALAGAYSAPIFVNGGSIGIAMICVLIVAYRRGTLAGVLTGVIMGLLDIADGFYVIASTWYLSLAQVFFDYIIAYPLVGLAGLFRKFAINQKNKKINIAWLIVGCLFGGLLKLGSHYFSGILFWNDPASFVWGFSNGYLYSIIYNGAYMLPCIILCTALMIFIGKKWPMILREPNSTLLFKKVATNNDNKEGNTHEKN